MGTTPFAEGRYGRITATVTTEESLAAALVWLCDRHGLNAPRKLPDAAFS